MPHELPIGFPWFWQSRLEKCPYLELFWSTFSHIRTEYGEVLRIPQYSVRMQKNADQNKPEYGDFLHSELLSESRDFGNYIYWYWFQKLIWFILKVRKTIFCYFAPLFFIKNIQSYQESKNVIFCSFETFFFSPPKWH